MKDFRSKMQSIFPAIPKNSASAVEWEEALKSKWNGRGGWIPIRLVQKGELWRRPTAEGLRGFSGRRQIGRSHGVGGVQCLRGRPAVFVLYFKIHVGARVCAVCLGEGKVSPKSEDYLKMIIWITSLCGGAPWGNTLFMTLTVKTKFCTWKKFY